MVKYLSDSNIEFIVPRESFIPAPNVTSAIISLRKNKKYSVTNEKLFFELIHKSFAKRRKTMINSLYLSDFNGMDKENLNKIFNQLGMDKNVRAEELEIEEYISIADAINFM